MLEMNRNTHSGGSVQTCENSLAASATDHFHSAMTDSAVYPPFL